MLAYKFVEHEINPLKELKVEFTHGHIQKFHALDKTSLRINLQNISTITEITEK